MLRLLSEVTDDGRYLIINVQRGTDPKNRIFYKNLVDPNSKVVELLDKADAEYTFIDNDGPAFAFRQPVVQMPQLRSRRALE